MKAKSITALALSSYIVLALVPVSADSAERSHVAFGDLIDGFVQRITGSNPVPPAEPVRKDNAPLPQPTQSLVQLPASAETSLREIQQILADLGYNPGVADGVMGKQTRMAIYEYQRAAGLPVDGVASHQLLASLRSHSAAFGTPEQASTALGENEIREIQRRLNELGYSSGLVSGVVGEETESSIYAYQRASGMTADGRPSRELLTSLRAESIGNAGASSNAGGSRIIKVPMPASLRRSEKAKYYKCERQVNTVRSSEGLPAIQLVTQQELHQEEHNKRKAMVADVYQYHATSGGTAGAGVPAGKSYLDAMQDQQEMLAARQMTRANERLNRYSAVQLEHEERASALIEIRQCVAGIGS